MDLEIPDSPDGCYGDVVNRVLGGIRDGTDEILRWIDASRRNAKRSGTIFGIGISDGADKVVGSQGFTSVEAHEPVAAKDGLGALHGAFEEIQTGLILQTSGLNDTQSLFKVVISRYGGGIMSHTESMAGPKSLKGHRTIVRWSLIVLVAILVIGALGLRFQFNEYAISPGNAENVAPRISIEGHPKPMVHGQILLTDVFLTKINWLTWIQMKFTKDVQIIPTNALVAPGVPDSELTAQGFLEMAQAKDSAKAAALTRLGYRFGAQAAGAQINQVAASSPAWHAFHVGDVITQANGAAIQSGCALVSALHNVAPHTKVVFTVLPATFSSTGTLSLGKAEHLSVALAQPPASEQDSSCPGVSGPSRGYLGIGLDDYVSYHFPFAISISTPNIGGPSAGLAMTLGIINELSDGKLLLGHTIAATGTMDAAGQVGDVGGVPQKAVTVQRAGASVFLVPVGEVGPARSTTGNAMDVEAVPTLDAALRVFAHLGGHITLASGAIVSPTTHP